MSDAPFAFDRGELEQFLEKYMEFYDHRSSFTVLSDRTKNRPWGLFGGGAARPSSPPALLLRMYSGEASLSPTSYFTRCLMKLMFWSSYNSARIGSSDLRIYS